MFPFRQGFRCRTTAPYRRIPLCQAEITKVGFPVLEATRACYSVAPPCGSPKCPTIHFLNVLTPFPIVNSVSYESQEEVSACVSLFFLSVCLSVCLSVRH